MKHLDLFSGIGGFALAARWMGWQTVQFVELDNFCQKVLAKNFPNTPIHDDIKPSTEQNTQGRLIFSQEDSHASPTVAQVKDLGKRTSDISGRRCLESLEKFNRPTSWVRTFMASLIGQGDWCSTKCKLTWRIKATRLHRLYFQLVPKTHLTDAIESGLLLPTPTAMDASGIKSLRNDSNILQGGRHSVSLTQMMALGILPTPTASIYRGSRTLEALEESGRNHTNSLVDYFAQTGKSSQLNPPFVEEMMGYPIGWTELNPSETP